MGPGSLGLCALSAIIIWATDSADDREKTATAACQPQSPTLRTATKYRMPATNLDYGVQEMHVGDQDVAIMGDKGRSNLQYLVRNGQRMRIF